MENYPPQGVKQSYRRIILGMVSMAIAAYLIAFIQSDRGMVYYNQYVAAYSVCVEQAMEVGAVQPDCNLVPAVRSPLRAHRQAFAVGEPFLNLALALSAGVVLVPLGRRLVRRVRYIFQQRGQGGAANGAS